MVEQRVEVDIDSISTQIEDIDFEVKDIDSEMKDIDSKVETKKDELKGFLDGSEGGDGCYHLT